MWNVFDKIITPGRLCCIACKSEFGLANNFKYWCVKSNSFGKKQCLLRKGKPVAIQLPPDKNGRVQKELRPPRKVRPKNRGYFVEKLLERDGYICGICKEPFREDLSGVNIDHIKPRSKGGTDDLENLQLTHTLCNFKKGDTWDG